jgi:phage gpG-like protein
MPDFDKLARNEAVKGARGLGIWMEGFESLQKALKEVDPEIRKAMRKELRSAARPVLAEARGLTPRRTGNLQKSLRVSTTNNGVALGSRLPYANLIHWGGSTGRGHVVGRRWSGASKVRESLFLSRALQNNEDEFIDALDRAVDNAAARAGFR